MMVTKNQEKKDQERKAKLTKNLFKVLGNSTPSSRKEQQLKIFKEKLKAPNSKLYVIVGWFWKLINIEGKSFGFKRDLSIEFAWQHHRSTIIRWIETLKSLGLIKTFQLSGSYDLRLTPTKRFLELLDDVEVMEIIERKNKNA